MHGPTREIEEAFNKTDERISIWGQTVCLDDDKPIIQKSFPILSHKTLERALAR